MIIHMSVKALIYIRCFAVAWNMLRHSIEIRIVRLCMSPQEDFVSLNKNPQLQELACD